MLIDQEIKKYTWNNSEYALTDESVRDYEIVVYKYYQGGRFIDADFEILLDNKLFNAQDLTSLELQGLKDFLKGRL
jgi:hypothetical protein